MKNQRENQVQTKSAASNVLIVILILITLATSAFGIFAWARYQTSVQGEGTAQVAKWNFKVTGDTTQTEQVVFAVTRTDGNTTVADGMLAPGTSGKIEMAIDVTGTQTDLIYTISGSTVNMPRNLKLYYDESRTQEMVVVNQQFSKGNYLKVADIGTEEKIIPETIYWAWPFETGETETAIEMNNEIDTEDMGKAMTIAITVEGKQLNDAPVLADLVQVGDYVNYDASSNGEKTFTSDDCLAGSSISGTISTAESFNSEAKSQWRVLSVDKEQGTVELMAVDPTVQRVTLEGINGYANAEIVLNNIGKIYDDGKGANLDSGRSISIVDIEKYSSYMKEEYTNGTYKYGDTNTYTFKTPGNTSVNLAGTEMIKLIGSEENPATVKQTYYYYTAQTYFSNSTIYNMIYKSSIDNSSKLNFWVASRSVNLSSENSFFRVHYANNGNVGSYSLYISNGETLSRECRVVPVVSLKSNIQTIGQNDNGVWQLKVNN